MFALYKCMHVYVQGNAHARVLHVHECVHMCMCTSTCMSVQVFALYKCMRVFTSVWVREHLSVCSSVGVCSQECMLHMCEHKCGCVCRSVRCECIVCEHMGVHDCVNVYLCSWLYLGVCMPVYPCVCVYMCLVNVCMHMHMCVCACVHVHPCPLCMCLCTCVYLYVYTSSHMCMCVPVFMCSIMCSCVCACALCIPLCTSVCLCVCASMCVHVYLCALCMCAHVHICVPVCLGVYTCV